MTHEIVVQRAGAAADPGHGVRIEVGAFGPWQTNAYLVWDGVSPDALVVDPGMGAATVLVARASELGVRLHVIANSHGHIDHIFDNAPLKAASGAPLAIHPDDAYRLTGQNIYGYQLEPVVSEQELREGDRVAIGRLSFTVLHTPGHTEGSVCLHEPDHRILMSGDVLFRGSYGRTDLPGGNDAQMIASLKRLLGEIPAQTRVLPRHGPETTFANEVPWMVRIVRAGILMTPD